MDVKELKSFAKTDRQLEVLEAIQRCGSPHNAAKVLGINERTLRRIVERVKKMAARQGHAPEHDMTKTVPDNYYVKGVSTLYDQNGELKAQWVKSWIDPDKQEELMREIIAAFKESLPRASISKSLKLTRSDELMNVHILTDYHLGMMAWHKESGEDWDIKIAEDLLIAWFEKACRMAPNAKFGVLAQLGDFLHWDGLEAVTPTSRHLLDADTRFQKVVSVAIRVLRRVLTMLLTKYETVRVLMADANHDPASAIWLREMFASFYEEDPRVLVDNSADTYYCIEHGLTSIFFHHGHKRKPEVVDDVFVSKFREVFGRTKFSYGHTGHLHHKFLKETNLMVVEQHRTMAAKDAYASRGGWMAGRSAPVISYHSRFGEVGRVDITPEMV